MRQADEDGKEGMSDSVTTAFSMNRSMSALHGPHPSSIAEASFREKKPVARMPPFPLQRQYSPLKEFPVGQPEQGLFKKNAISGCVRPRVHIYNADGGRKQESKAVR